MEFFDKKQEVIDLQITPLGKRLLQMGEFHPEFYAFFDHDVIYNNQSCNLVEAQNEIETRIQETPRLKQQTYLYSAEEKINKNTVDTYGSNFVTFEENLFEDVNLLGSQKLTEEYLPESLENKQYQLEKFGPLGNMAFSDDNIPAWDLSFYLAPLTGTVALQTGSYNQKIPQLHVDSQYRISILEMGDLAENVSQQDMDAISDALTGHDYNLSSFDYDSFASPVTADGSYLMTVEDPLFIKAIENNTEFLDQNVEVEVYKIFDNGEEKRLYFSDGSRDVSDNPEFVDYYFDVQVDTEIPDGYYCRAVKEEKLIATYTDKFVFNCQDLVDELDTAPQVYNIPDNSDEELCD